ncbi:MAG: hypothetical protein K2N56_11885 [Oscillospiraceae bacterium]|nr:hypothetical protein [Oscillospiraceae bacterium]
MKKFTSILCAAAVFANLAALTGCNSGGTSDNSGDSQVSSPVSDSNDSIDNSGGSGSSDDSSSSDNSDSAPKPQKPDGEPTFLIGLDGEPVYTSELSEIHKIDRETHEEIPVETLDHENLFDVVCDGFTYIYMPRPAVNCMDDPELFEDEYYIGEELSDDYEFFRLNVGDKIGDLTVRSASALFRAVYGSNEVYDRGLVKFDGEVELTGYVNVETEAPLYPGGGGNITFFPDAGSSVKIPMTYFDRNFDNGKARRLVWSEFGWYGDRSILALGNIADIDSELREGDEFVKVKVTVKDIKLDYWASAVIKDIELV